MKIALVILLTIFSFFDGFSQWKKVYDSNSTYTTLFTDGNNVIARNNNGVMFTRDSGKSWIQVDTSIAMKMAIDFVRKDSAIFATSLSLGNHVGGVYFSIDSGLTWKRSSSWPFTSNPSKIAISGNNILVITDLDRIVISKDNGISWDTSNTGLPSYKYGTPPYYQTRILRGFIFNKGNVYVFSNNDEYVSFNNGVSWHLKKDSCPFGSGNGISIGDSIFAGGYNQGAHIYISPDSGLTWNINFSPNVLADGIGTIGRLGEFLFAAINNEGVVFSKDKGQNWIFINAGLSQEGAANLTFVHNDIYCSNNIGQIFKRSLTDATGINYVYNNSFELIHLKVYPNPMKFSSTFEFGRVLNNGILRIYDLNGKQIETISNINSQSLLLKRNNLVNGQYFYELEEKQKKLACGKLIVN